MPTASQRAAVRSDYYRFLSRFCGLLLGSVLLAAVWR
jgi:hypothetical protein